MRIRLGEFWASDHSLSILLWVLGLAIFLVIPSLALLGATEWERVILAVFFTSIVLSGLAAAWKDQVVRRLVIGAATLPLLLYWLDAATHGSHAVLALVDSGVRLSFTAILAAVLFGRVVAKGPVSKARLKGAVAVYLMVGVLFAEGYRVLSIAYPDALSVHGSNSFNVRLTAELMYFSFSTLTTAGYGDIVPVHPLARSMANLEAITGQMYLVLLIGRLLSLHLAQETPSPAQAEEMRATSPRRPRQEG